MMTERPKFSIPLTLLDRVIEYTAYAIILALWIFTVASFSGLPSIIPTHFNASGKPDGFGGRFTILLLPLIVTLLFGIMTFISRFPHVFNYTVKITGQNAFRQYSIAIRMIRFLKLSLVITFGIISLRTIQTAKGQSEGLGSWFLPVTIALIFIPLIFFVIQSQRAR